VTSASLVLMVVCMSHPPISPSWQKPQPNLGENVDTVVDDVDTVVDDEELGLRKPVKPKLQPRDPFRPDLGPLGPLGGPGYEVPFTPEALLRLYMIPVTIALAVPVIELLRQFVANVFPKIRRNVQIAHVMPKDPKDDPRGWRICRVINCYKESRRQPGWRILCEDSLTGHEFVTISKRIVPAPGLEDKLIWAAASGDLKRVRRYTEQIPVGRRFYCMDLEGRTPIYFSVLRKQSNITRYLALESRGFDVNLDPRRSKISPLYLAVRQNDLENVKILLQSGCLVEKPSPHEMWATPLMLAAKMGKAEIALELLRHGANPNRKIKDVPYPIHDAIKSGSCACVRALLEHKANPNTLCFEGNLNVTSLMLAIKLKSIEMARCLLEYGADVNWASEEGATALFMAATENNYEMAECLLRAGAEPNPVYSQKQQPNQAFLKQLEKLNHSLPDDKEGRKLVDQMLRREEVILGTNENATLSGTALKKDERDQIYNALMGSTGTVTIGVTPLMIACQGGHLRLASLLVDFGAAVNIRNELVKWVSPLQVAAKGGFHKICMYLLSKGADPEAHDIYGQTASHSAMSEGHVDLAKYLFSHEREAYVRRQRQGIPHSRDRFLPKQAPTSRLNDIGVDSSLCIVNPSKEGPRHLGPDNDLDGPRVIDIDDE